MAREAAPISDYVTDLRGVLDNAVRVMQALIDLAADAGYLSTTLVAMSLVQGLNQVCILQALHGSVTAKCMRAASGVHAWWVSVIISYS